METQMKTLKMHGNTVVLRSEITAFPLHRICFFRSLWTTRLVKKDRQQCS
nr:MAG TPA: hypothetical protein [Bacteriophage sp.]